MLKTVKHQAGRAFPALTHRNFQIYFIGQLVSLVGTWMQITAEQWLVFPVLTNSKILLGLVGVAANLPTTLLVLFTGVFADRVNKKTIMYATQILFMLYAFMLSYLVWSNKITIWYVLLFALLNGITFAFDMPTRQAFIVETVDKRESLASAISLNSAAWNMARTIAPPIAGLLIATVGIAACYFFNAVSFLAVIASLMLIKVAVFQPVPQTKSLTYHFKEGIVYVFHHREILLLLSALSLFSVFSFSFTTLLPVYTTEIFHADEKVFGLLGAAMGLGATIGAFSFSLLFSRIQRKNRLMILLTMVCFVSLSIFAFSESLWLSLTVLIFAGICASSIISAINTLVQLSIPDLLRGRVMSFYSLVFVGSMPLGSLYAGFGAHFIGAPLTVFIGVLISTVSMIVIFSNLSFSANKF